MQTDHNKVQAAHAKIAEAVKAAKSAGANDLEIGAAFGMALGQLGGTAAGVEHIANFAKTSLQPKN